MEQALNIDGCRVPSTEPMPVFERTGYGLETNTYDMGHGKLLGYEERGRYPANVMHDGSEEVLAEFAKAGKSRSRKSILTSKPGEIYGGGKGLPAHTGEYGFDDEGTPARFFASFKYCPKANPKERGDANNHPTVKPIALMRYLVRLVTPRGGITLDPFLGSGTPR